DERDPRSRAAMGRAYSDLGLLTWRIGQIDEALAAHRKALAVRRELAARPGADPDVAADVVRSLLSIGDLQLQMGDTPGARASFEEGLAAAEGLERAGRQSDMGRFALARALLLAGSQRAPSDPTGTMAMYDRALAILKPLAHDNLREHDFSDWLARCHVHIGLIFTQIGQFDRAMAAQE